MAFIPTCDAPQQIDFSSRPSSTIPISTLPICYKLQEEILGEDYDRENWCDSRMVKVSERENTCCYRCKKCGYRMEFVDTDEGFDWSFFYEHQDEITETFTTFLHILQPTHTPDSIGKVDMVTASQFIDFFIM